ncbi:MAG: glycine cleavage system protein GcvH [Acidiferrobacterales bacterium]|nr:glycine cleavage system protein GcvH [Acidiferrobacterales bacterium]
MSEIRYTQDHEWVRVVSENIVEIGITDFAQDQLGDIVFIELPQVDVSVDASDEIAVIESVKAAAELRSPVSGTVVESNEELEERPELVNENPTEDGWFCKLEMSSPEELNDLLGEDEYNEYVASLE